MTSTTPTTVGRFRVSSIQISRTGASIQLDGQITDDEVTFLRDYYFRSTDNMRNGTASIVVDDGGQPNG